MGRLNTPCWRRKKSCGGDNGCSWFNGFKPVPGWRAKATTIKAPNSNNAIDSFEVMDCPQFEQDKHTQKKTQKQLAKELGISERTLQRRIKRKNGGKFNECKN